MQAPSLITAAIEIAINHLLALDPGSPERLRPLAGRSVAMHLDPPGLSLCFLFTDRHVSVSNRELAAPDAFLHGSPAAIARLAAGGAAAGETGVKTGGETHVLQGFRVLLAELNVDWEILFSRLLGPAVAQDAAHAAEAAHEWVDRSGETIQREMHGRLCGESGPLPGREEVEALLDSVDRLRDDVERLDARIALIEARRSGGRAG